MKQAIIVICLFFGAFQTKAQNLCGTELTENVRVWLADRQNNIEQYARKGTSALYVPVHIHIVGNNNGVGHFNKAYAYNVVCELNYHFAPMDITFFLEGAITYINNDNYYNPTLPYTNQMMNNYNVDDVCNIYFVPQLTGLCGFAYYPNSGPDMGRGGVVLKNSCTLPHNTDPTHELGHYFSLLHTFQDWNSPNAEFVDGSNCSTNGDLFCDTRADYLDYRWDCPYTGTQLDAHGDLYQPDSSLYMSYANAPCPHRFSPQQQTAIIYTRTIDRNYLDNIPVPAFTPLAVASLFTPADNDMNVPSSNNAHFSWSPVPGAMEYNLRIKLATISTFDSSVINIVTTNPFADINGLTVGATYNWKVFPLNYNQTCVYCDSSISQVRTFSVIYSVGIEQNTKEVNSIAIYPNPVVEGNATLLFTTDVGKEAHLQLMNIDGKVILSKDIMTVIGENTIPLSIESLSNGIYLLSISTKEYHITKNLPN